MKHILIFTVLLLAIWHSECRQGVVLHTSFNYSTTAIRCLISSGYNGVVIGMDSNSTQIDDFDIRQLNQVSAAGYNAVDLVFMPCKGRVAKEEVAEFVSKVHHGQYQRVWLFANSNVDKKCSWIEPGTNKCDLFAAFLAEFKGHGIPVGIFAIQ